MVVAARAVSVGGFDLPGSPGLVEPGFQWAVDAQDREPALAGTRLDPVPGASFGLGGAELDDEVAVVLGVHALGLAVDARVGVVGLQQGAGLGVVDVDGPEGLGGDRGGQGERVAASAIQPRAVGVAGGEGVLGADADGGVGHRGGDAGADVVHHRAGVEQPGAVGEELVAATDERGRPCAVGVVVDRGIAGREHEAAHDAGPDARGGVEDRAHPLVGRKRLPGDDPDGGELAGALGIQRRGGLVGHDRGDLLEVREVVGVHAVELGLGEVEELRGRRIVGLGQRVYAGGHQALHAPQRTDDQPARVGRRLRDEVAAGHVPVVVRAGGSGTCRPSPDRGRRGRGR